MVANKEKMICENLDVKNGELVLGTQSTVKLAKEYGTPLIAYDEVRIRSNMRLYKQAMAKYFGEDSLPCFASKAASFKQIYRIAMEEGLGTDVVSAGEIYIAKSAGFPMEKAYFHGNNKTDEDINYAIDNGVGYFVCDNIDEIDALDLIAEAHGIKQKILIRITPGIDPHTYAAVATGKVDSKFGSAVATGAAEEITAHALNKKNITLCGFHCHVGSQIFDSSVYLATSKIMLEFIADMKLRYGYETLELNLGGGYGVRYTDADPTIDIAENIKTVGEAVNAHCKRLGINKPAIRLEPGRSIVADAALTLYTVGSVKQIPGYKNYVSVDGGMTDNPRFALYGSKYTVIAANKADDTCSLNCSLVGRCCESGDILAEGINLPSSIKRGDTVAVLTTGAYNYSMASNYNKVGRPAIVMVNGGKSYVAVKRESFEDLARNDI